MKKTFALLLAAFLICASGHGKTVRRTFYSDGLCFYLVHPGGDLNLDLRIYQFKEGYRGMPALRNTPAALLTLYNPAEDLVQKHYWQKSAEEPESRLPIAVKNAPAGIWQLRSNFATNCNLALDFTMPDNLKYGLLFSRCKILPEDLPHMRSNYFLVPPYRRNFQQTLDKTAPGVNRIHLANRGHEIRLRDARNRNLGTCDTYDLVGARPDIFGNAHIDLPRGVTEENIPVIGGTMILSDANRKEMVRLGPCSNMVVPLETGRIYHLGYQGSNPGHLGVDGFPVILCKDIETARTINGSCVPGPDGKVFSWKYQLEIYKWLKSLTAEDMKVDIVPVTKYKKEWLKYDPKLIFLPLFSCLEPLLKAQQCDPAAKNFGNSRNIEMNFLFWLYAYDRPFNPYYKNRAILNRFLAFYLLKWLEITESGAMFDDPGESPYCGGLEWVGWETMALPGDYSLLPLISRLTDLKVMKPLAFGMTLPVHRFFSTRLACENQSMHMPLKMHGLHIMTGDPFYRMLAHQYMKDYADPDMSFWMKTGYPMESYGLDGTYTGITTSMLAFTMRLFNDYTGLDSLKRTYNLMNHTVVPEPEGAFSATAGFAHRTQGTWLHRQYGGGTFLLRDQLEDAAVLHRYDPPYRNYSPEQRSAEFDRWAAQKMPADLNGWLKTAGRNLTLYAVSAFANNWSYGYFGINKAVQEPRLPVEKEDCFSKNFNDEFVAERRPAYYAFLNTITKSWRSHHDRNEDTLFAPGVRMVDGALRGSNVSRTWMPVPGLELFWTPKFGSFLTSRNWSMYTHCLTRLDQNGKTVNYPANYSSEKEISHGKTSLIQPGKWGNVTFRRTIVPMEQGISMTVSADAQTAEQPGALVEQIPYLIKKDLDFHFFRNGVKCPLPGKDISELLVTRANGSSIRICFDKPVDIRQGVRSVSMYDRNEQLGLLEITFDRQFTKTSTLNYQILANDK